MGQKVHPTGFRIAITEQWRSRWYANKKDFAKNLIEDFKIRKFIRKEWAFAAIPKVEIVRRPCGPSLLSAIHHRP